LLVLEVRQGEPDFRRRWGQFVRSVVPLLPGLRPEAAEWWKAADDYESGRLDMNGLLAVQNDAWRYLFGLPIGTPTAEYCAVRASMLPLWGHNPLLGHNTGGECGEWFDGAWVFLADCGAAGVGQSELFPIFQAVYPEFGELFWWDPAWRQSQDGAGGTV
jgi:hypothetical protein